MIARSTLTLVGIVVLLALYIGLFLAAINTSTDAGNSFIVDPEQISSDTVPVLNDRAENFFYFIQITDTHFNHYNDQNRSQDLRLFCKNVLPVIQPPVMVLTGDITDSRANNPMGSEQYKSEWDSYNKTRLSCLGDNPDMVMLDIRGNHDNFNVHGDTNAYYKNYTFQAKQSKDAKSYRYEYSAEDGNRYSFIGVDACFHPGIRRPFNFIGKLEPDELKKIEGLKEQSKNTNYTIWFGHYPTSSITNARDLQKLIDGPYLCGHYHNFHGLANQMWSSQPEGFFEVELGDWKSSRYFRINVIDGGLYSFADFNYDVLQADKPMVVVTNPRSVLFQMEKYEKFWRTERSSHIRAAVFSKTPLKSVYACVAKSKAQAQAGKDCLKKFTMSVFQAPLYGAEWSPKKYKAGLYWIGVFAENDGYQASEVVPFSLDRTKPKYSVFGRFSVRASFEWFGLIVYASSVFAILATLVLIRLTTGYDKSNLVHYANLARKNFFRKQFFKLYLVSQMNMFFYPLVIIPIAMSFGPWMVARMVEDHIGVVFIWKQIVDGYWLPTAFSYLYAALYLYLFHIPSIMTLGTLILRRTGERFRQVSISTNVGGDSDAGSGSHIEVLQNKIGFVDYVISAYCAFLVVFSLVYSSMYYFSYGILAMVTSLFTWSSVVYGVLFYKAWMIKHVQHID